MTLAKYPRLERSSIGAENQVGRLAWKSTSNAFRQSRRLLASYANLEIALLNCVANVRRDFDGVFKSMFCTRSVNQRINVGDALGRQIYDNYGLGNDFSIGGRAMPYCLRIRNQYAHCNWYDDNSGQLAFVNLEELSDLNAQVADLRGHTTHHVDASLTGTREVF